MKLFKKVLAATTVLTLAFSAVPVSAATDVIDFEDGNVPASIIMATVNDDGVTPDGDPAILSVVDFQGSKMLKIDTQENGTPKVKFLLASLVGEDNVANVGGIEYDLYIEQPSGEVAGWNGGTIGAGPWAAGGAWYNGVGFTIEDYENATTAVNHLKETINAGLGFADSTGFFMFMNWANNGTDDYIDNVKILDKDGNAMELVGLAGDAAATDTATDTTAATDTTSTAPKTGTTSYALFFAAGAAVMLTGAVVLKRRKTVEE
jgi:LPXTG-motif cell wall-anchored protein